MIPQIVQENNKEKGEMYQDIFLEIAKNNVKNIIEGNDIQILTILLDLMGIGCQEHDDVEESLNEKIRGRYQTPFWKEFIKQLSELGSEAYKFEKLQVFQDIF